MAFDQATQPALRSSLELSAEPSAAVLEREKARDLWESLSLEPEVAQERQTERKRLLLRAENSSRELVAAKTKALELQAQLTTARDERFNHPLVYAGAAGMLGLGALWLFERRKRLQLQDRELDRLAQQSPSFRSNSAAESATSPDELHSYLPQQGMAFSLEDSPDLANDFATDLNGLPDTGRLDLPSQELMPAQTMPPAPSPVALPAVKATGSVVAQSPNASSAPNLPSAAPQPLPAIKAPVAEPDSPDWARPKSKDLQQPTDESDASWKKQDKGLLSLSKRVLGNMLRRRSEQDAFNSTQVASNSHASTHANSAAPSTQFLEHAGDATQMLYDEEAQEAFEQELLAQQLSAGLHASYKPDEVDQKQPSQSRIPPQHGESTMEYLLEMRTAVNGLRALGRHEAAAKLLEEHIDTEPDTCAWVYLEYMNLCERMGWRDPFEVTRKLYRQQFNRMAPYWHEPNANVLGLDGYARAVSELCAAWAQGPAHAHNTLASWLAGPILGRKLVQLPAYHDLFDLYEMLEYLDAAVGMPRAQTSSQRSPAATEPTNALLISGFPVDTNLAGMLDEPEFVPTVSLLDLDYEFSSDVTLQAKEVQQSEQAVTIVKPGNFSVDFNVAGTQMGAMPSIPAALPKK